MSEQAPQAATPSPEDIAAVNAQRREAELQDVAALAQHIQTHPEQAWTNPLVRQHTHEIAGNMVAVTEGEGKDQRTSYFYDTATTDERVQIPGEVAAPILGMYEEAMLDAKQSYASMLAETGAADAGRNLRSSHPRHGAQQSNEAAVGRIERDDDPANHKLLAHRVGAQAARGVFASLGETHSALAGDDERTAVNASIQPGFRGSADKPEKSSEEPVTREHQAVPAAEQPSAASTPETPEQQTGAASQAESSAGPQYARLHPQSEQLLYATAVATNDLAGKVEELTSMFGGRREKAAPQESKPVTDEEWVKIMKRPRQIPPELWDKFSGPAKWTELERREGKRIPAPNHISEQAWQHMPNKLKFEQASLVAEAIDLRNKEAEAKTKGQDFDTKLLARKQEVETTLQNANYEAWAGPKSEEEMKQLRERQSQMETELRKQQDSGNVDEQLVRAHKMNRASLAAAEAWVNMKDAPEPEDWQIFESFDKAAAINKLSGTYARLKDPNDLSQMKPEDQRAYLRNQREIEVFATHAPLTPIGSVRRYQFGMSRRDRRKARKVTNPNLGRTDRAFGKEIVAEYKDGVRVEKVIPKRKTTVKVVKGIQERTRNTKDKLFWTPPSAEEIQRQKDRKYTDGPTRRQRLAKWKSKKTEKLGEFGDNVNDRVKGVASRAKDSAKRAIKPRDAQDKQAGRHRAQPKQNASQSEVRGGIRTFSPQDKKPKNQ